MSASIEAIIPRRQTPSRTRSLGATTPSNKGAAKESDGPDVIAATVKRPRIILRLAVGWTGFFDEHAELPIKPDEVSG
jgi:hypothetical protein